jgi:hypothetical protein
MIYKNLLINVERRVPIGPIELRFRTLAMPTSILRVSREVYQGATDNLNFHLVHRKYQKPTLVLRLTNNTRPGNPLLTRRISQVQAFKHHLMHVLANDQYDRIPSPESPVVIPYDLIRLLPRCLRVTDNYKFGVFLTEMIRQARHYKGISVRLIVGVINPMDRTYLRNLLTHYFGFVDTIPVGNVPQALSWMNMLGTWPLVDFYLENYLHVPHWTTVLITLHTDHTVAPDCVNWFINMLWDLVLSWLAEPIMVFVALVTALAMALMH